MKKGQNKNYQKHAFQTGVGGRKEYNDIIAALREKSQSEKKAITICKKRKRK